MDAGLAGLDDDECGGGLRSSRRLAAWQDGVELAAVAELDTRRMARAARPRSSRASEHVSEELAAALVPMYDTALGPLAPGMTLRQIGLRDRLRELDFEIPLAGGDVRGAAPDASG